MDHTTYATALPLSQGQSSGNRETPLVLGEGLFGRVNQSIQSANCELMRIRQMLGAAADRVYGPQPQGVTDGSSDRREPHSAADALNAATENTHRLIKDIDDQLSRLLGGF